MNPVLESTVLEGSSSASRSQVRPGLAVLKDANGASIPEPRVRDAEERLRRVLNVVIAAAALVISAPLFALIALLVKLSSPGPVIYTQTRVGIDRRRPGDDRWSGLRKIDYGGRLFTIYKFRTMRAEPNSTLQIWASPNDSRITAIGHILRKYRLDELPQLFNVLKGDMNIVGPRPEQPNIFLRLRDEVENYHLRQMVLPGITGWAQINHHYDRSIEDVRRKVTLDLQYLQQRSALHDLRILVQTIPVMLLRRGAI